MNLLILVPIFLGIATIFQASINKYISFNLGLNQMALLTNLISLSLCLILYFFFLLNPESSPSLFQIKKGFSFKLWYIIPGILGFLIVIGIPWAMSELGAIKVSILLISAQIVASLFWDLVIDKISISSNNIIGAMFALIGSVMVIMK